MDRVELDSGRVFQGVVIREDSVVTIETTRGVLSFPATGIRSLTRLGANEARMGLSEAYLLEGRADEASEALDTIPAGTVWDATVQALREKIAERLTPARIVPTDSEGALDLLIQRQRRPLSGVNLAYPPPRDDWGENRDALHLILARRALERFDNPGAKRHLRAIAPDSPMAARAAELWKQVKTVDESPLPVLEPDSPQPVPTPREKSLGIDVERLVRSWPTRAKVTEELVSWVIEAAEERGVPVDLALALVETESAWNARAKSPKGAGGLMQLMPATAEELGVRDRFDPRQNIQGGMAYLAALRELYADDDLALAAYNAGPGAVKRAGGVPNYRETKGYIKRANAIRRRLVPILAEATRQ